MSPEFLQTARSLTRDADALLICDEIQCGLGRTGRWFAYQHYGVVPDVTTVAKPLGGGYPVGAMLTTEKAAAALSPGMHGTTFGGSPLACAVAISVIDAIRREGLLGKVTQVGSYFSNGLEQLSREHACVRAVRGLGLMIGVELDSPESAKAVLDGMLQRGFILNRTSENVLRFLPPYILERSHVDLALAALGDALAELATAPVYASADRGEFHE